MAAGCTLWNSQLVMLWFVRYVQVTSTVCNVAHTCTTDQSSDMYTQNGGSSSWAVDGNRDSDLFHKSCTHTLPDMNPWWLVDLGRNYTVRQVVLYNREDCCGKDTLGERLHDVHVGVTSDDPGSPVLGTYPLCGTHPGIVGNMAHITCPQGIRGRYVIVQLHGKEYLTLCEVEVFRGVTDTVPMSERSVYTRVERGHRLPGQSFMTVREVRKLECVALCLQYEECLSVNFSCNDEMGCECELNRGPCSCSPPDMISDTNTSWMKV